MVDIGGVGEGINPMIQALQSGDDVAAQAAVEQLAALPGQNQTDVVGALGTLLDHPLADVRWWAVCALSRVSRPEVGQFLQRALQDPDTSVRCAAALGLRSHPHPPAIVPLASALAGRDPFLARLAADALAAHGSLAVPHLVELLRDGPPGAQALAARALGEIGEPDAIPGLVAALDGDSAILEYWATQALERMGVGMAFFRPE